MDGHFSYFFRSLQTLKSIGAKTKNKLTSLVGERVVDLLFHLPNQIIDRSHRPSLNEAQADQIATLDIIVEKHVFPPKFRKVPTKVICHDANHPDNRKLTLSFFRANRDYIEKALPVGERRLVSGKISVYKNDLSILHPDYILPLNQAHQMIPFEPVYPLTQGLSNPLIRKAIDEIIKDLPDMPEWLDSEWMRQNQWLSFKESLRALHHPTSTILPENARKRLAYDEILSSQIALSQARVKAKKSHGFSLSPAYQLREKLLASLPFTLTNAQKRVIQEIDHDLKEPYRMRRLVQGDVGSGKTLVALMAIFSVIENKKQAVLMAPTEILARQHYEKILKYVSEFGIQICLMIGKQTEQEKKRLRRLVAFGDIDLVIGTHAVFQDKVQFKNLRLIVIDEQHRFGVAQRLALAEKGETTDVLAMTATPIPRSLAMTIYGDMDLSAIDELPANRKPIETILLSDQKIESLIDRLKKQIECGAKVYWVCPLVEESEKLDLMASESRARMLKDYFGDQVGLIHGRLRSHEKEEVMHAFSDSNGKTKILVATTVIEVGVDVPSATIMVIEHAERFGLSQLHQLRGRVGRGDQQSHCILMYGKNITPTGLKRLQVMRETNDGFQIAEHDLLLRGAGDVLGVKQSGLPAFRMADFVADRDLLQKAITEAKYLSDHPEIRKDQRQTLLVLFDRIPKPKHFFAG
ncbi:MAG: ATP-dependent DNA helicase RecG [Alphaproteobacteria bacterium]|nr:ATP-dependent DNA helicase RecG [Alphaproteobacteria bacterium]